MANSNWNEINDLPELNWKTIIERIEPKLKNNAYVYVACTDKVYLLNISDEIITQISFDKLLELRIFNSYGEFRITRPTVDFDFKIRVKIDEPCLPSAVYFDQWQYLDINAQSIVNDSRVVSTINGGNYSIPVTPITNLQIKVRNYVKYNEKDGQARVFDWRLVEFGKEGK